MVGGESIQFGRALPLGGGQWRLGHLLRARNATEDIAGLHPAGTPFALIDPATLFLLDTADGEAVRGGTIEWAAVGGASTDQIALGQNGRAALPLSPVHPFAEREGASIRIGWVRRSRTGFSWRDQVDVPIAEAEARFRLILTPAAGAAMIHESTEPEILFDRAALAALAGGADIAATVHQLGDYGVSPACTFAIAAALLL
jgi:hypothetical protein